jgi:hypothetical protein
MGFSEISGDLEANDRRGFRNLEAPAQSRCTGPSRGVSREQIREA